MQGGLQELRPGSTSSRQEGQGHRLSCEDALQRTGCCVWPLASHPRHPPSPAPCWVELTGGLSASESSGHERQCPGRSNETQAAWALSYPTNIPQTGSKRTNPSRNIQIQKVKSSRKPWNVDRSSEKQNVANSSRRAWRDVPSVAGFPSWRSGASVTDSLWGSLPSAT